MSNSKHTPGPWQSIKEESVRFDQTTGEKFEISHHWVSADKDLKKRVCLLAQENESHNAARIVSCVNAMEGVESPSQLRECFDEMLAILVALDLKPVDLAAKEFAQLRTLIKKARGKAEEVNYE